MSHEPANLVRIEPDEREPALVQDRRPLVLGDMAGHALERSGDTYSSSHDTSLAPSSDDANALP
jgi:hypothetical protein